MCHGDTSMFFYKFCKKEPAFKTKGIEGFRTIIQENNSYYNCYIGDFIQTTDFRPGSSIIIVISCFEFVFLNIEDLSHKLDEVAQLRLIVHDITIIVYQF